MAAGMGSAFKISIRLWISVSVPLGVPGELETGSSPL